MVEIEIDGKTVEVQEGSMLLEAANKVGIYIPHFCYHKKLSIAANCRMCLVDVEKAPKAVPACATPVGEGMIVRTGSEKTIKAQQSVMEFLLINHPLDCPICDQGGECQLQDLAMGYGGNGSRYQEEKRVIHYKDVGPLISMKEMNRCIQCTRCVRFGEEVAGVMELGMVNRGEHAEIATFVGKTVDSELSGNMIDLCPVGALTSKPFRYSARTWELSRRKSVSPHDSVGANLIIQVKDSKVKRVLPLENESVNECWISDKERFAYTALNSEDRLTKPMLKQGGEWVEVDWQTALEYVAHGLRNVRHEHGAESIASVAAPYATLEELYLLQKMTRGIGSDHVDFRLRQSDFSLDHQMTPWLGLSIADVSRLDRLFIIGSFFRKDHPLLAARVRQSHAEVNVLHAVDDDWRIDTKHKVIVSPDQWIDVLHQVMTVISQDKSVDLPEGVSAKTVSAEAQAIAQSLLSGERKAIFIGNAAANYPAASQCHMAAQWIALYTGATLGYLTEAGNTVGGYVANAYPKEAKHAAELFASPKKAYVLLHAEPEIESYNPQQARAALAGADMVVVMSAFKHGADYADVMLPVSPFTETSGSFINVEGRVQSFNGAVKPLEQTRPAWKVLRVLGNLLEIPHFDYETSEEIRDEIVHGETLVTGLNTQVTEVKFVATPTANSQLMRVADVPIHATDAIVRRSAVLQETFDGRIPQVGLSAQLAQKIGVQEGEAVVVKQGQGQVSLTAHIDPFLPEQVVRVAASHHVTAALGDMFGAITVEKA